MVSITQFNKGKASQLFAKVNNGISLVVVKNNTPIAVITSPEEYEALREISKLCSEHCRCNNNTESGQMNALLEKLKTIDRNGESNV